MLIYVFPSLFGILTPHKMFAQKLSLYWNPTVVLFSLLVYLPRLVYLPNQTSQYVLQIKNN
jgi:hypothetical protein